MDCCKLSGKTAVITGAGAGIDMLINNAGGAGAPVPALEITDESFYAAILNGGSIDEL
jgi:NAD(P)-dependent dehydrogenase (short-subunit alcohol dehydrogenase family)